MKIRFKINLCYSNYDDYLKKYVFSVYTVLEDEEITYNRIINCINAKKGKCKTL